MMLEYLVSAEFWVGLIKIIGVNIILSGDNAVVIALAARSLPPKQQTQAIIWGSGAAIVMRILLTLFAVALLTLPWLKIVGSVLRFWIGVKRLVPEDDDAEIEASTQLLSAIKTILIADLVMSLDNVIAVAAAAGGSILLLILGLAISIPLVIFGATLLLKLMERFPVIITIGGALIGWVAGEMLVTDPALEGWLTGIGVEFVVPAGTGGGADQMARAIQGIIAKHGLMKQSMVVINKAGGAGAEGFLDVKGAKGDAHKIIITLSNLFTTPLATGVPFNWKDMTPVSMMALDQFVLWVHAETPYKTAKDYLAAVKAGGPNKTKMGGTGSKQEDQILTVGIERATGTKFIYVPFKGGGEVAVQLVGKHVDSTVNNPIEAVAQWRAGQLRPLCVFDDKRMPYKAKVTDTLSWGDIPTCKEAGIST